VAEIVYVLCALTSATCTVLLTRAWSRTRLSLLGWSALCFALLTVNNVLLFVDLVVITDTDLSVARSATGLAGLVVLLYGLISHRQLRGRRG
jgi:hypothetical protein